MGKRKGTGRGKSSRPAFKRTEWGVWAHNNITGGRLYLGTVQAESRGQAKRNAAELEIWKTHPHFNGTTEGNKHGNWKLSVGVPR